MSKAALFPSFEEGRQRRSSKCHVTLHSALPGRSNHCRHKILTSPRCALSKVATYLFIGRIDPSSKEGIEPFPRSSQFIHTFYDRACIHQAAGRGVLAPGVTASSAVWPPAVRHFQISSSAMVIASTSGPSITPTGPVRTIAPKMAKTVGTV